MQFLSGFMWGSGLSLGICVGLVAWVFLRTLTQKVLGITEEWDSIRDHNRKSIAALEARNELTEETNIAIQKIASYLDLMSRHKE